MTERQFITDEAMTFDAKAQQAKFLHGGQENKPVDSNPYNGWTKVIKTLIQDPVATAELLDRLEDEEGKNLWASGSVPADKAKEIHQRYTDARRAATVLHLSTEPFAAAQQLPDEVRTSLDGARTYLGGFLYEQLAKPRQTPALRGLASHKVPAETTIHSDAEIARDVFDGRSPVGEPTMLERTSYVVFESSTS